MSEELEIDEKQFYINFKNECYKELQRDKRKEILEYQLYKMLQTQLKVKRCIEILKNRLKNLSKN